MQISPSISTNVFAQYAKEGEATLNNLVESLNINFDTDFQARALLKDFIRYAYYGEKAEFKTRYKGDLYETQIRYI